ncbi:MAG: CinA family protein [Gammaproteobacteria bacterium]
MNEQSDSYGDEALREQAEAVAAYCLERGFSVATAESCTGGWIAKCLTDIAGSSEWFRGGVVTYSDAPKTSLLGVETDLLATHGAVSEAVALAMARGALTVSGADGAVAVTGVAGPGGGSAEKPVGTVWIAWAWRGVEPTARRWCFAGDREAVRRATVVEALAGLYRGR